MKSFLTNDKVSPRPEPGARQFIGLDANVDLPINKPLAQLGPGELFGEMTCRTYQPRSTTVQAREPCVMIEMLRVILDMLVGNRQVSDLTKATSRVKVPTFKGTSFKADLDKKYRERPLDNHPKRFFGDALLVQDELIQTAWSPARHYQAHHTH